MKADLFVLLFSLVLISGNCERKGPYIDGVYKGISKAMYTAEEFYGAAEITIKNGWIAKVDFKIIDKKNNELFDDKYELHYKDNELYQQQCRNDRKGVQKYPLELLKYQKMDNIDAVSGATWSYNMFKYSIIEALKNAIKK
jgi:major membrane immunogen (membrane-anchored lipoprotein)